LRLRLLVCRPTDGAGYILCSLHGLRRESSGLRLRLLIYRPADGCSFLHISDFLGYYLYKRQKTNFRIKLLVKKVFF